MPPPFLPRLVFPTLDSLPRSYYLGHHAAGLAKMRTMLSQIDLVIECRDYRIPLTSRNPMFEESLAGRERVVVYTKMDLGTASGGQAQESNEDKRAYSHVSNQRHHLLTTHHAPTPLLFAAHKSPRTTRLLLAHLRTAAAHLNNLTGSHLMIVGMPNVGKSSLLNALRHEGVGKGKVAQTGAQPGVTRKIGTGVKIIDVVAEDAAAEKKRAEGGGGAGNTAGGSGLGGSVYLLDTPGVFIPYVPSPTAMLKLALCGSVKDTIIPPFTLADYLLYHLNLVSPALYSAYHEPTNDVMRLLEAIARKTGRLQKGGEPELEATAMWMVQRWRQGHLGRFCLDEVSEEALEVYGRGEEGAGSVNQARRAGKEALRVRAKARRAAAGGVG
ncbi:hypothetical protein LTR08_005178 [Meristemomyces frigidus]|nr:hypothetical protein LTR08_005178 [Meristemomyces frigidus]